MKTQTIGRRDLVVGALGVVPLSVAAQTQPSPVTNVLVIIDLKAAPDSIEEVRTMLLDGLSFIRTFDGNRDAALHVNQDDPLNLLFVEHWASRAHYERYRAARLERGDNARLVAMLAEPLSVRAFDVIG